MSQGSEHPEGGIAHQAECETWRLVRRGVRRTLGRSVTIGFLYSMAAIGVGAYLIVVVAEITSDAVVWRGWESEKLDVSWMTTLVLGYGVMAVLSVVGYVVAMLLIMNRLPDPLCRVFSGLPWIGSTYRMVSLGAFCELFYGAVLRSEAYSVAFTNASTELGDPSLRGWSKRSLRAFDSGMPLAGALRYCPYREQPLAAISAMVTSNPSAAETVSVWHHAAIECHALAQSRLQRATMVISVTCVTGSVMLASFAMLVSMMALSEIASGWMQLGGMLF